MKKTFLLLFALLPMLLSAQNLAPVQHENGKWGFAKIISNYFGHVEYGDFVIKPKFENAHPFVGEYAFVCKKGRWGIINKDGKFVVKPKYDYASIPYGNITIVKLGERLGFVENGRKEVVFAGKYKEIVPLQNGIFAICTDKWEFMDADEKSVQHPGNVLLYTSTNGKTIDRSIRGYYGDYYFCQVNVVSNTYHNDQGIMVFDEPVTSIEENAFSDCDGLTSITIPNSVTKIGRSAFSGCKSLTSITIPNSVTEIGSYAFYNCKSLTSITIPDSVTKIGEEAFSGCSSLPVIDGIRYADTYWVEVVDKTQTSYSIKPGVLYIPASAFENCQSLTSITIPNSVTWIGYEAFRGCSSLTNITIPNSVTSIGNNAFYDCDGLKSITIPDSVTEIGDKAFYGCIGLTSITLPESVTTLGRETFAYCINLKNVTTGNRLADVADDCFVSCTSLPVIDGIMYAGGILVKVVESRSSYSIKQGTSYILAGAFYDCDGLTSITIPDSVTKIGEEAFKYCDNLTRVNVNISDLARYCTSNPMLGIPGYTHLYINGREITNLVIPDSVTKIGDYALCGCNGLKSITIPNSVTEIGNQAFSCCNGLTSVTIGNGVTSIGYSAFSYCSSLTSITIPDSVTKIGAEAFEHCDGLKTVYCNAAVPPTLHTRLYGGFGGFSYSYPLPFCTIYVPAASLTKYINAEVWKYYKERIRAR